MKYLASPAKFQFNIIRIKRSDAAIFTKNGGSGPDDFVTFFLRPDFLFHNFRIFNFWNINRHLRIIINVLNTPAARIDKPAADSRMATPTIETYDASVITVPAASHKSTKSISLTLGYGLYVLAPRYGRKFRQPINSILPPECSQISALRLYSCVILR